MVIKMPTKLNLDEWEIKEWIARLGSMPVEIIEDCDRSAAYEVTKFKVLKLENGNYATVEENGCSCYTASEANIEIFSSKEEAVKQFEKWERDQNNSVYSEPCSCGKHVKKVD
jgi:hypothetical protein